MNAVASISLGEEAHAYLPRAATRCAVMAERMMGVSARKCQLLDTSR